MCSQSQLLVSECQIGQHSSLAPARPGCGYKSQVIFCRAGTQPGLVTVCTGPPCYICHCQTQLIINLPRAAPRCCRPSSSCQLLACCLRRGQSCPGHSSCGPVRSSAAPARAGMLEQPRQAGAGLGWAQGRGCRPRGLQTPSTRPGPAANCFLRTPEEETWHRCGRA